MCRSIKHGVQVPLHAIQKKCSLPARTVPWYEKCSSRTGVTQQMSCSLAPHASSTACFNWLLRSKYWSSMYPLLSQQHQATCILSHRSEGGHGCIVILIVPTIAQLQDRHIH